MIGKGRNPFSQLIQNFDVPLSTPFVPKRGTINASKIPIFDSKKLFHPINRINHMTRSSKFSALFAILVVGFLSIYANVMVFNSTNTTQYQQTITLNLQSGAQVPVALPPGGAVPTQLNGDVVTGVTVYGQTIPAGANAMFQSPNGTEQLMWQMAGGQAGGLQVAPSSTTEQD